MDEEEQKGYTWEAGYAEGLNIKEVLEEDETGSIEKSIAKYVLEARKKQRCIDKPAKVRLGIMRYVYIVLDFSRFIQNKSMPPSKYFVTMKVIDNFLDKFFEQNPIAQAGFIICKDKKADRFISLTGNIRTIKEQLATLNEASCSGDFSLQSSLQVALANLKELPGHVSREVIVLMASLTSVDGGSIFSTFELLKAYNIRCSVIGLSAEIFVCKQLSKVTNGRYDIVLDPDHMELLMSNHTTPPPSMKSTECSAVRVGFPPHAAINVNSFCQCHPLTQPVSDRGFLCEQCGARHCSLPAECRICKLTLVAAPQLARAFRHLLPLPAFQSVTIEEDECAGCEQPITLEGFACKNCSHVFCFDCDLLLHESLHICPRCD
ncbi:unnamed protein product [Auanema sp. JU1783]|nr:unnamed protein product [Auanema sp. JU1783]